MMLVHKSIPPKLGATLRFYKDFSKLYLDELPTRQKCNSRELVTVIVLFMIIIALQGGSISKANCVEEERVSGV